MPIRKDLRPLYRTPEWAAARAVVFARAAGVCESCGAVQGTLYSSLSTRREVLVQLGCAHLDHEDPARFLDDQNLRAWCRACHLRHDKPVHATHRAIRKDRARPLLQEAV